MVIKLVLNEINGNEMNDNEMNDNEMNDNEMNDNEINVNEIIEKIHNFMILGNPLDPQCRGDVVRRLLNPRLPSRGRTAQERT
jgi:hypothetical protein